MYHHRKYYKLFFFNSTSSISIKNYKTRNYKNTSYVYHITLCLLSLDGRWRHNKKVEQTKMYDVQSAKRGLKTYQICFFQNGIIPWIFGNVLHVFYFTFCSSLEHWSNSSLSCNRSLISTVSASWVCRIPAST